MAEPEGRGGREGKEFKKPLNDEDNERDRSETSPGLETKTYLGTS